MYGSSASTRDPTRWTPAPHDRPTPSPFLQTARPTLGGHVAVQRGGDQSCNVGGRSIISLDDGGNARTST